MGHEVGNDPIYVFGPFSLNARKHRLTKKGKRVDLDVKPTQVLLALVEQAGKLVSKEDLLRQVWGGIAVSDDSFYQHVSVLRKTLGQHRKDNKYIMTIPGAGYKFVAPVKIVDRIENAGPVEIVAPVKIAAPVETMAPVEIAAPVKTVAPIETVAPVEQGQGNVEPDWVIDAVVEMLQGNTKTDEEKGSITVGPDKDNRVMDDAERDWQNSQLEERLNREEDAARKVGVRHANEVHYHPEMDDDDQEDYESVDI